jgi:hypothetical protein
MLRNLTAQEILLLEQMGSSADDWSQVLVAEGFSPSQVRGCRFGGAVEIGKDVVLVDSHIANYRIGARSQVRSTIALECREASTFGNGVSVAAVNENGGRAIKIHTALSAQVAYIGAMYRHRPRLVEALEARAQLVADESRSTMGVVGCDCRIIGAKFVREVNLFNGATIEGASLVENATLMSGAYVGVDAKVQNAIVVEGARVDTGATLNRCFVGECAVVAGGFSAVDTLFFANSHCENGEACSVFAGPYTVSHHRSSLLIAGLFSFFNAGSGTNQSNHLFKSGAVHQAVHRRGCKFASNAYVMAPSAEGAFTTVLGRHTHHHDTSEFPFSYLMERDSLSYLLPGYGLQSYGTARDVAKWPQRDRRSVCRDLISFEEYNPVLAGAAVEAVKRLELLASQSPHADQYRYKGVVISRSMLQRGLSLYRQYIAASLAAMLSQGSSEATVCDRWIDLGGAYVRQAVVETLLDEVEAGVVEVAAIDLRLRAEAERYSDEAHGWAKALFVEREGREPSVEDISALEVVAEPLSRLVAADAERDADPETGVGYGVDSLDDQVRMADFKAVRGL